VKPANATSDIKIPLRKTRSFLKKRTKKLLFILLFWPLSTKAAPHHFDILALSPDGEHIASVEGETLVIRDTKDATTYHVALPCACAPDWPTWSPDGTHLAFTLPIPGTHARAVYTVDPAGNGLQKRLDFPGTLVWLRYGPDGRLAALARQDATKEAGATKPGAPLLGDLSTAPPEQRVAILDPQGLTWASPPDLNVYEFDWRPTGGFVGTAAPGDADAHWWQARLYAFDTEGAAHLLFAPSDPAFQIAVPKISPDGRAVSFIGGLMSDYSGVGGDPYVLPLDQPASPRNIRPGLAATVTSLDWACRPGRLRATLLAQERTEIAEFDLTGAAPPDLLWSGEEVLTGNDSQVLTACRAGLSATIHESFTRPQEIAIARDGAWHDLTQSNAGLSAPVEVKNITWRNDGLPGQGWLLLPAGTTTRLPMVTVVHGGPAWASQPGFLGPGLHRALLDHGYALFLPNPRGSFGQGEAFTHANIRDLGHGDLRDILAGVDAAIAAAPIDPARLGITGLSYGGFMTMWAATAAAGRFRAGVAQAGISDWQSYAGTAGIVGWLLPYFGASIYDDPAIYLASSPVAHIHEAHMPTLALVGADDIECPPTQTIEFWHALQAVGVPADAVIYPGEGHGLRDPAHIADAANRAISWFDRYLK